MKRLHATKTPGFPRFVVGLENGVTVGDNGIVRQDKLKYKECIG